MKEYSFLNINLLINGTEIGGFDEGDDTITLERIQDSASGIWGNDGEMTVSISSHRGGTVTFRILQTSDSNEFLSGLISSQENGAFVPIFVQMKDVRGGDLGSGTQGFINRPATMTRGENANAQEWAITVERLDMLHNGA
jgi:hypothetical protein